MVRGVLMLVNIRKKNAREYQYIVVSTNDVFALNAKKVH